MKLKDLAMGTLAPGPSCPTPAHLPVSPIGYGPPSGLGAGEAWETGFGSGGGSHLRNTQGPPCCCPPPRNPPVPLPAVSSLSFPPSHHLLPPAPPPQESIRNPPRPFWCHVTQYPPGGTTLSSPCLFPGCRRSQLQGVYPGLRARPPGVALSRGREEGAWAPGSPPTHTLTPSPFLGRDEWS